MGEREEAEPRTRILPTPRPEARNRRGWAVRPGVIIGGVVRVRVEKVNRKSERKHEVEGIRAKKDKEES